MARTFYVYSGLIAVLLVLTVNGASQGTWQRLESPATGILNTVFFTDSLYGWVAGDSGVIIHTSDGGTDWTVQESNTTNDIVDIFFLNRDTGWASSYNFTAPPFGTLLLRTVDGGATWVPWPYPEEDVFITCILFRDPLNGWMGGKPHALLRTTDGGASWNHAAVDTSVLAFFPVLDITFWDEHYGYACGGIFDVAGVIWRTSDGGNLWHALDPSFAPADEVHALHLFDSVNVMGAGGDPDFGYGVGMIRSSDGGVTWEYDELSIQGYATDLGFRNERECWAPLGPRRKMIFSLDTGRTWTDVVTPDSTAIFRLTFPDSLHGFAVGMEGAVLKFVPQTGMSSAGPGSETDPGLSNYPNPFTGKTVIRFTAPHGAGADKVDLRVYDVYGNLVKVLVRDDLLPGEHRVAFDAAGLPGGLYICCLEISGHDGVCRSAARARMILLE